MLPKWHHAIQLLLLVRSIKSTSTHNPSANFPGCPYNSTTVLQTLHLWTYRGCYDDDNNHRLLNSTGYYGPDNNTVSSCNDFCEGYRFFGVEYSAQCFCSNSLDTTSETYLASDANCNFACCADRTISCGGLGHISVYEVIEQSSTLSAFTASPTPTQTSSSVNDGGSNTNSKSWVTQSSTVISNGSAPTQPSNVLKDSGGNSNASNNINLGIGLGFGLPMLILATVTLGLKWSNRRHKRRSEKADGDTSGRPSRESSVVGTGEPDSEIYLQAQEFYKVI